MDQKELGIHGERLAIEFLRQHDFEILETNWRFGKIELDIIARQKDFLVIIEVKTRENSYLNDPWESVTLSKQRRIIKAANHYIVTNAIDLECRFDILSIVHNSKYTTIDHIEEAFYPLV